MSSKANSAPAGAGASPAPPPASSKASPAPPEAILVHVARAPGTAVEARRALDVALDAVVEGSGAREALAALVPAEGPPEVRLTAGLSEPAASTLRDLGRRLLEWPGRPVPLPGVEGPVEGMAAEVGDGSLALVLAAGADPGAFAAVAPAALLGAVRAALLLRERRRETEVTRLNHIAQRVAASLDLDEMLSEIVRDAVALLGADSGDIDLKDPERGVMRVVAVARFPPEMVGFEFGPDEGLSSRAMATKRPVVVADYQRSPLGIRRLDRYGFRAVACVPLVAREEAIGTLNVHHTDPRHRFGREEVRLLVHFANHAAIAIDNVRRYQNEVRLARDLTHTAEELARSLTLQQRLVEQVLQDRGLAGIAEELAGLLGRPVVLHDHLLRTLAGAQPPGGGAWEPLTLPRDRAAHPETAAFLARLAETGRAEELPPASAGEPPRLVVPVRAPGPEPAAYLVVETGPEPAPLDRALIEVASTAVALELAKLRARVEVEERLRGDMAADLLAGSFTSPEAVAARAEHLGHDLTEPRDVIVLELDPPDPSAAGDGRERSRRFFEVVRSTVAMVSPASIVARDGESVVLLAAQSPPERGGFGALAPEEVARWIGEEATVHLPGWSVSAAVGERCERPEQYAGSFRLARSTLQAARKLGRRGDVTAAQDLGVYRLLIQAGSPGELRDFARRTLAPLLRQDRERGSKLVATLRAYVDAGFNQRETARRSFVHVNTVAYRLRTIEGLLGADLSDPDALLGLALALRVADLSDLSHLSDLSDLE